MSKQIKIFDTTLRDGEQSPGCSMNLHEKVELAKQLERLGVDIIEAGFAIASDDDFESIRSIAEVVKKCTVASLARATKGDIERAADAVKNAAHPRIHTFIATSDIHMKYKLKMSPDEVLRRTDEMVRLAKGLCDDVQFSAEDASRSDPAFLAKVFETAILAGATVLNIPDTVGYASPQEMFDLVTYVRGHVKGADRVDIAVHCHDDLGLAVANTLSGIRAGATQAECTVNGIGERAGNAALEEITMILNTRRDYYDAVCGIDTKQIYRTSKMLSGITGVAIAPNKSVVGANAFAHESGIHQHGVLADKSTYEIMEPESIGIPQNVMVLGKHSGRHAFDDRLKSLGYSLTPEELNAAFTRFKALADKKKVVNDRDIEALVSGMQYEHTEAMFTLERFVVNSGNTITATANVTLKKLDDGELERVAIGHGPIDAAFKAIDKITKVDVTLEDFKIDAVTEGEDAQGEAIVKLCCKGETYTGRGVSTDIIEASIKAYLNGVNKIVAGV